METGDKKMKPKIAYISIEASDLFASFVFYKDGMGLLTNGIKTNPEEHACFKLGNGLSLVLYEKKRTHGSHTLAAGETVRSSLIISHCADSKEEVDLILQKALNAGAKQVGQIQNEPWSYAAKFADPDGYQWEIIWEA